MEKITSLIEIKEHSKKKITLILTLFVLYFNPVNSLTLKNDIKTWLNLFEKKSSQQYHLGISYKPEIYLEIFQNKSFSIDLETTADLSFQNIKNDAKTFSETAADFYRSWIRLNAEKFEIRLGLQQINYGPAFLLRSLKWFDQIDPQDLLVETDGVTSLLLRYFFLNNANLWLWGIYAKDELKGLESFASKEYGYEFGGRIQYPFEFCETAFSFHHRELEFGNTLENRFGIDARWDFQIGLWLEVVASKFSKDNFTPNWEKFLTFGADYTINLGNGIHVLGEHFVYSNSENDFYESSYKTESSAISLIILSDYLIISQQL